MMGDSRKKAAVRLCRSDIHSAINLHRIGINNFRIIAEKFRQTIGFTDSRWTKKQNNSRLIRHQWKI